MFAVCTLINSGYTFNSILGLSFIFHCFGYDNEFETKENKIQTKDKIIWTTTYTNNF